MRQNRSILQPRHGPTHRCPDMLFGKNAWAGVVSIATQQVKPGLDASRQDSGDCSQVPSLDARRRVGVSLGLRM
jgi:hypothetical protein